MFIMCLGCTTFHSKQVDKDGRVTDLVAMAWFSSAQHLDKLRASQTEKTQSFGLSALEQQGATNTAATIDAVTRLLQILLQSAPK
jgi:hypothetical protein